MADGPQGPFDSDLLRGLFGSFQAGAAGHAATADIWSDLRSNAASWLFAAQGRETPYDPAELQQVGKGILTAQGIDAATVSTWRGLAGQWLQAKENLAGREPGEQVLASDIFQPPWATTNDSSVPSRYRIRTQWQVEPAAGDVFTRWRTTEIEGEITDLDSLLAQGQPTPDTTSGRLILSGIGPPELLDYSVEQI